MNQGSQYKKQSSTNTKSDLNKKLYVNIFPAAS